MVIVISVATIALCFIFIAIRLYTFSMRVEQSLRRIEDFITRMESETGPILYDTRHVMSEVREIVEVAKSRTKRVDYIIEGLIGPAKTLSIFLKAMKVGIRTLRKKERR